MAQTKYNVGKLGVQVTADVSPATTALLKFAQSMKTTDTVSKQTNDSVRKMSSSFGSLKNVLLTSIGIGSLAQGFGKLAGAFRDGAKEAISFVENYNLFNVSMRGNVEEQLKFQYALNEAFKTNMSETLRYQGFFTNLSSSLGITNDATHTLSQNLTKLTYDLSSLFNVDVQTIYSKLQSGIIGQTKPLRTLGIDVTMQTLQPYLYDMGINKKVTELTQAEKVLLRYIAILDQSKNAQGDYARTIETSANQLRLMKNQLDETSRWFGTLFEPALRSVLPYANAFLIVLKEIFKWLSLAMGFDLSEFNYLGEIDVADGLEEDMTGALDASEKLKKSLYGFDEINNVTTPDTTAQGGGSVMNTLLDQLNALGDYDNLMEGVRTKADLIADAIMSWLGFTQKTNEVTGEMNYVLEGFSANLAIVTAGVSLLGFGIIASILKPIISVIGFMSSLGTTSTATATAVSASAGTAGTAISGMAMVIGASVGAVLAIFTALIDFWNDTTEEAQLFRERVSKDFEAFGKIVAMIAETVSPLIKTIGDAFIFVWEEGLKPLWEDFKVFAGSLFNLIMGIVNGIMVLANVIMTVLSPIMELFVSMFSTALTSISQMLGGFFRFVAGIIDLIIGLFTFDGEKIASSFFNVFTGIAKVIYGFVTGIVNWVIDTINGFIRIYNSTAGNVFGKLDLLKKFGALNINTNLPSNTGNTLGGQTNSNVQMYANGGMPSSGQLFIAREAGAELVGGFNGKTGVMNNSQIVEAVSIGVANAVASVIGGNGQSVNIYLDDTLVGSAIIDSINKASATTGKSVLAFD